MHQQDCTGATLKGLLGKSEGLGLLMTSDVIEELKSHLCFLQELLKIYAES